MMKKRILFSLLAVTVFSIIPALFYIRNLAKPVDFQFSPSSSEWADFGSFFGGVLGPFYALCAFVGVLVTVYLQNRQILDFKSRAEVDDVQKLVFTTSQIIDHYLNTSPPECGVDKLSGSTLFSLLSGGGIAALGRPLNRSPEDHKLLADAVREAAELEFFVLTEEFEQLAWLLLKFSEMSVSPVILAFYKMRYQYKVLWLFALGYVNERSATYRFFDPAKLKATDYPKSEPQNHKT